MSARRGEGVAARVRDEGLRPLPLSLVFVLLALVSLPGGDFGVATLDPWGELRALGAGLLSPRLYGWEATGSAFLHTVAFGVVGVLVAAVGGLLLPLGFHHRAVRGGCAFARAVHELFWALLLMQMLGLSPLTGLLAIAIPYAGVFAKVYSEILEEADPRAADALPRGVGTTAAFFYARLPDCWVHIRSYTLYRLECGLRASAVLGFVGLPTLGFYLESAFAQRHYPEAWGLLILLYLLIGTVRWWARPRLLPLLAIGCIALLPESQGISLQNILRFLTEDIVPAPLREGGVLEGTTWEAMGTWMGAILGGRALEGLVNTVLLSQVALVGTGILALAWFPLVSRRMMGRWGQGGGHVVLVVLRSTPEYMLAYVLLQIWGPSMLPAAVALAIHNGAIIAHLIGHQADELPLRPDHPSRGLDLYLWELIPRLYGAFLAFLFYRWEWIIRETAILGILGIHTLGFYVDSALAEFRFDDALVLVVLSALLNMGVDAISRMLRGRLRMGRRVREAAEAGVPSPATGSG